MRGALVVMCLLAGGCDLVFDLEGSLPTDAQGPSDETADANDGRSPDEPPPLLCSMLANFDVALPGRPGRSYWLITEDLGFDSYVSLCNSAAPGATHLFAPTALDDVFVMLGIIKTRALSNGVDPAYVRTPFYIGAVQTSPEALDTNWKVLTGEPLPAAWASKSGVSTEPDDFDGTENRQEQLAALRYSNDADISDGLYDFDSTFTDGAICECDGRTVDPDLATLLIDAP